jgi:hypothetical protein
MSGIAICTRAHCSTYNQANKQANQIDLSVSIFVDGVHHVISGVAFQPKLLQQPMDLI